MSSNKSKVTFKSSLAPLMEQFVREKRAVGYRYESGASELMRFDQFLAQHATERGVLPRSVALAWLAKRPTESPHTQQNRFTVVRQFAEFMCRLGHPAYVPDRSQSAKGHSTFAPRIFTHREVRRLLQEVDRLAPTARSPIRNLVMPEIFRLLCGCGLRAGEVVKLRNDDVDLNRGVLTVRDTKFRKDRLVPPAVPLIERLRSYDAAVSAVVGARRGDAFFFPSLRSGQCRRNSVYVVFRQLLFRCGIPHAGRGKGPRVHDLRHYSGIRLILGRSVHGYRELAPLQHVA